MSPESPVWHRCRAAFSRCFTPLRKTIMWFSRATSQISRQDSTLRPVLKQRSRKRPWLEMLEERLVLSTGDPTTLAPSLGSPPAPSTSVIWVNTAAALQNAVANLQSGQTVVIQKGTYNLSNSLTIANGSNITNVTIRGETDNFNDVVLLGKGMDNASYGSVPSGISVYNAQNVTIADLSIGGVYYHPIEIKGEAGAS